MNSKRTVVIAAALALAAIAAFLVIYKINNVEKEAYGKAKLVDVWVVKKPIPKGLTGSQALGQAYIEAGKIPSEFRPGSALNANTIKDIDNLVAINALSEGQVVVDGHFVDPNVAQVTFAERIPRGQVAVTVSVDQVHGVAGLLVAGDKVNILVNQKDPNDPAKVGIKALYQNVNILNVGNKPAPAAGDTTTAAATGDSGLITFAVPLEAAQRIALAAGGIDGTSIYLTLVPPDNSVVDSPLILSDNLNAPTPTPYPVP